MTFISGKMKISVILIEIQPLGLCGHTAGYKAIFGGPSESEIFIDNLLVRVHWTIEMIVVERPCAMGV